jgi:hypothetical protein
LDLFEEVERSIGASNAHVEWGLQVWMLPCYTHNNCKVCFQPSALGMSHAIGSWTISFTMHGVWLDLCIMQCTYLPFTTSINYGAWVLMEFWFC